MQCTFILGFETLITFLEDLFLLLEEIKFPDTNLSPRTYPFAFIYARSLAQKYEHTHSHIVFYKVFSQENNERRCDVHDDDSFFCFQAAAFDDAREEEHY